eukprot:10337594-Lingulodinium_polyedra.AAC.1
MLLSQASNTWMLPIFAPARRWKPVSSNFSARTSVSTFSFCNTMPLDMFTSRNTALEFAATKTCGLKGRKVATCTAELSVKTLSISPPSMVQKRTDMSME